ncbi:hypothetical protein NXC14_PA00151 (plasmid) [Rhizobium sp. NXC14]|uniref:hypothetical protein n=1 Tax=Rhizobium sp. NXC14 TaxID=1981173 RepID=UPI000A2016B6|nr:hypothetical protein [Rhizobium sp. NXC14]ARO32437.1 hypothetical protein NXC14_PA00151 [Rhizobium sp. NXC14]
MEIGTSQAELSLIEWMDPIQAIDLIDVPQALYHGVIKLADAAAPRKGWQAVPGRFEQKYRT